QKSFRDETISSLFHPKKSVSKDVLVQNLIFIPKNTFWDEIWPKWWNVVEQESFLGTKHFCPKNPFEWHKYYSEGRVFVRT
ncbi:hypothetical protein, partial [Salmonella sp. gx-f5]|uniref:hypothetical protein n=1 Tax=Salmonella sp. gx-f5 TaxID=2582605 RepID=UPI001F37451E